MHLHMQMNEECGTVWGCEGLCEASPHQTVLMFTESQTHSVRAKMGGYPQRHSGASGSPPGPAEAKEHHSSSRLPVTLCGAETLLEATSAEKHRLLA